MTDDEPAIAKCPLPHGWRWVGLGEVCEQDKTIVEPHSSTAKELPYLSLEDVESGTGRILKATAGCNDSNGQSTTFMFDERHVLYGKLRPYLNKVALADFRGRCTTEMIPLLPKESTIREFLGWLLRRGETVQAAMRQKTGSRMPRADMDDLLTLVIPLPPPSEQQRIVAILTEQMAAVGRARAAAEAQLKAAKALPTAYLRAVFISSEAKQWPRKRLGEVCEIQLGKMLSPKSSVGVRLRPYLRNANVQWNRFDLTDVAKMDIREEEENKLTLKAGDLLVCEGGEPGRAAVWSGQISPCYYQKALHRLRPINRAVDSNFIMYRLWFGAHQGEFLGSHAKTTIAHLPAIRLNELPIGVPTLNQQKNIVAHLSERMATVEKTKMFLEGQLATINALPAALLRQAFSGAL